MSYWKWTHWKITWYWERLKAKGEGHDRGCDGYLASPTQQTWVWANSGRWWRTGKPGVLQSMGSQTVGQDLATDQQQHDEINWSNRIFFNLMVYPTTVMPVIKKFNFSYLFKMATLSYNLFCHTIVPTSGHSILIHSCVYTSMCSIPLVLMYWGSVYFNRNVDLQCFKCTEKWYSFLYIYMFFFIGKGNGNPLQCSCLENPRDGGAWWAAIVYGVAQSRTRLKWLSSSSSMFFFRFFPF